MGRKFAPEKVRGLLDVLASGVNPREVARRTGVSKSYLYRLHHKVGGVYRPTGTTYDSRYLDREERYEIARLYDQGLSMRQIARRLARSPSTISRELARNRDRRSGSYIPERAERLAWERQLRPKESLLARCPRLRQVVQDGLDKGWSPEQIAGRLPVDYPDDEQMRISHETIYMSLYVYPRGDLKRELVGALRTGRTKRQRRGGPRARGLITDPVPIAQRPQEVEGRLIPGHHEGDLIKGSRDSNSAVGTIVERTSGLLTLINLQDGYQSEKVAQEVVRELSKLPAWFTKSLTWDRGSEMARHEQITSAGIQVYFADPYSPWQRGSNENTNGLLRQYLPKGTDLSVYTPQDLREIADQLNDRPRKRHGFLTPREIFNRLLTEHEDVATTP